MWDIKISPLQRLVALPLSWAAQALGKGHVYVPGNKGQERQSYVLSVDFEDNRLTSNSDMYDYLVNLATELPDRQTAAPSMGWLYQALRECKALSHIPSPNIPCLTICGDQDELVDIEAVLKRMNHWDGGQFVKIQNAKHDVLSEMPEIRELAIARFCELFEKAGRD
jgi:lysophospholipase